MRTRPSVRPSASQPASRLVSQEAEQPLQPGPQSSDHPRASSSFPAPLGLRLTPSHPRIFALGSPVSWRRPARMPRQGQGAGRTARRKGDFPLLASLAPPPTWGGGGGVASRRGARPRPRPSCGGLRARARSSGGAR